MLDERTDVITQKHKDNVRRVFEVFEVRIIAETDSHGPQVEHVFCAREDCCGCLQSGGEADVAGGTRMGMKCSKGYVMLKSLGSTALNKSFECI